MEPLWSPLVATGGKRWQIAQPRKRRNYAKTVAMGCDRLRKAAHGKEGSTVRVRQRACTKALQSGAFVSRELARSPACDRYGALYGALKFRTRAESVGNGRIRRKARGR